MNVENVDIEYGELFSLAQQAALIATAREGTGRFSIDELREARINFINRFALETASATFIIGDPKGNSMFIGVVISPQTSELNEDKGKFVNLTFRSTTPSVSEFSTPTNVGGAGQPEFL